MDKKSISLPTQIAGTAHPLAARGTEPASTEAQKKQALEEMAVALGLWQMQRPDLRHDINPVGLCLLQHNYADGRLDLTGLQDNPALPGMPLLVWHRLRDVFSVHGERTPSISLPPSCLTGWPAKHTVAALNIMAPVGLLHIDLPDTGIVDLRGLGQGQHQPPPQTIHVNVSVRHGAGEVSTVLRAPVDSLVLGNNPRGSVTVVQGAQSMPLGTGASASSSSSSSSSSASSSSSSSSSTSSSPSTSTS